MPLLVSGGNVPLLVVGSEGGMLLLLSGGGMPLLLSGGGMSLLVSGGDMPLLLSGAANSGWSWQWSPQNLVARNLHGDCAGVGAAELKSICKLFVKDLLRIFHMQEWCVIAMQVAAQKRELHMQVLSSLENANKRDDLPPSQGGKYIGFGSGPPPSKSVRQDDYGAMFSKGIGSVGCCACCCALALRLCSQKLDAALPSGLHHAGSKCAAQQAKWSVPQKAM
eukprot:1142123-Pelagomonas_calceolata.AAC.4